MPRLNQLTTRLATVAKAGFRFVIVLAAILELLQLAQSAARFLSSRIRTSRNRRYRG
jgi:hypothetical protein